MKAATILVPCLLLIAPISRAASHEVIIPGLGKDLVAYCFNTNTLENAVPNPPDNSIIWLWNAASQQYSSSIGGSGSWFPNSTLTPGQGFFLYNPLATNYTYTIQGTPLTNSSYTLTFPNSTNLYLVGSAYDIDVDGGANWIECVHDCFVSYHYTQASYNYQSHDGDTVMYWCPDLQEFSAEVVRTTQACTSGSGVVKWSETACTECPPQLSWSVFCGGSLNSGGHHRAFFLKPAGGTTSWTQLLGGQTCGQ